MKNKAIHPHWLIINLYIALGARWFIFQITVADFFVIFLSSRNHSVGCIWRIARNSSTFKGNRSINPALSAHTRDFYLIAPAAFHSFFSPLVFSCLTIVTVKFSFPIWCFIHLPQKRMYLHFFDELCCKHSSYLLKNQLLQGYKIR